MTATYYNETDLDEVLNLVDNLPFIQEQFEEAMEKVVQAAKVEVEAHTKGIVYAVGLDAIQQQRALLEGDGVNVREAKRVESVAVTAGDGKDGGR